MLYTHTYSQYWDKLSSSNVDFIGELATVLLVWKKKMLFFSVSHTHFHQPLRVLFDLKKQKYSVFGKHF